MINLDKPKLYGYGSGYYPVYGDGYGYGDGNGDG